jgi:spermidine dehydrogenase
MTDRISRRDFINGVAMTIAGVSHIESAGAATPVADAPQASPPDALYPPLRSGLRGSHVGSFEAAHRMRDGRPFDTGGVPVSERYDLVVVGAGLSGLSAAHFYRQHRPTARILVLDTNDDFGGHAKRNEFDVDGTLLIGYGGTQAIDSPKRRWDGVSLQLLRDLGIDLARLEAGLDEEFYARWNLQHGLFFKKETFGAERLVRRPVGAWYDWDDKAGDAQALRAYIEQFPLSERARAQLLEMIAGDRDVLPGMERRQRRALLEHTSYRDFLVRYWDADPDLLKLLQTRTHDLWAIGIDGVPVTEVLGMPGLRAQVAALGAKLEDEHEVYAYHFPDGNASIARLLVRRLIPASAPGSTMEDVVLGRFDYGALDRPEQAVRIRLNSTAVDVRNTAQGVEVAYVKGGTVTRVAARDCVLACYQAMIPYIAPETGPAQRAALHQNVRAPLVYVTLAARHWEPWRKLGVAYIDNPGGTFSAFLDFPVSIGGYRFAAAPSEPVCIHLQHMPTAPNQGLTAREQYRIGRARIYATSFEEYEREIRDELGRMLGPAGFDFDRDIAAITVNRWPHGYSYSPTTLFDDPAQQPALAKTARQRLGRIAIANADSGWDAYSNIAISEAHRAVHELLG